MNILRVLAVMAFVAGLSLFATGIIISETRQAGAPAVRDDFDLRSPVVESTPTVTQEVEATVSPTATATPYDGRVVAMKIPSRGINYPIEYLGLIELDGGGTQLDTPHDETGAIGWYNVEGYGKPGFGQNAIFSAHVNYNRKDGPFAKLAGVEANDDVIVVMEDGREYHYAVQSRRTYVVNEDWATEDLPVIKMGELINAPDRPANEEWVTLITCSCEPGRVIDDRGQITNNLGECLDRTVVVARRTS